MTTETQMRSQLIRRIQRIPTNKLNELDEILSRLERKSSNKDKILSYAGIWSDLDSEIVENLTTRKRDISFKFESH